MERSVNIGPSEAFYESRNHVVVIIISVTVSACIKRLFDMEKLYL